MSLPKYMEARPMKRGGVTYRVRLPDGRKVTLGHDLDRALADYKRLMPVDQQLPDALAIELWSRCRRSAAARSIAFELTPEDVAAVVARAGGRCEVTGRRFNNLQRPGSRMRPWAASIDRIDSARGYEPANCRLVCAAVNLAMNRFGDALFIEIVQAMVRKAVQPELDLHFPRGLRSLGAVGNQLSRDENAD